MLARVVPRGMVAAAAILAAALGFPLTGSVASEPHCTEGDRFYPHGRIVKMGARYFRCCHGTHSAPNTAPVHKFMYVRPNQRAAEQAADFPQIHVTFSLNELRFEDVRTRLIERYSEPATPRRMGGILYLARISKHGVGRTPPPTTLYLYDPILNPDHGELPPHMLNCIGEDSLHQRGGAYSCFLSVKYGDLIIKDQFIDVTRYGGRPIPFDLIPDYARGLPQIFDRMDVTGEIGQLRGVVDVIE